MLAFEAGLGNYIIHTAVQFFDETYTSAFDNSIKKEDTVRQITKTGDGWTYNESGSSSIKLYETTYPTGYRFDVSFMFSPRT